jgi:hypothetical protein
VCYYPEGSGRSSVESELEKVRRYILQGREAVVAQKQRIESMKARGQDTMIAEGLLGQFERILAIFEKDLRELRANGGSNQKPDMPLN